MALTGRNFAQAQASVKMALYNAINGDSQGDLKVIYEEVRDDGE